MPTPFDYLTEIREDQFSYFEVSKRFDVSINNIKRNAEIPAHTHAHDVFNYVVHGEFIMRTGTFERRYAPGEWLYIKAHEAHGLTTLTDVTLLELWI